jgi:thioredoxin 2
MTSSRSGPEPTRTANPADGSAGLGSATAGGPVTMLMCRNCGKANTIRPSARGSPHCGSCGKPLAWVVNAGETTFELEAKASPTVVIDLWAPWCGPCRFVSPILDELAHEYAGRLKLIKVNVDDSQGLARRFDAMSIPTLVVLRDGEVVNRIVGALPKDQLDAQIRPYLKPPKGRAAPARN